MFSILFRIFLLVFLFWLLRRFLAAFTAAPKRPEPGKNSTGSANHMVKDPVCGMYMDSRLAVRLEGREEDFYFCSEECKNKYLGKSSEDDTGSAEAR
jgi:uncharacterized protein